MATAFPVKRDERVIPRLQASGFSFVADAERDRKLRLPFLDMLAAGRCAFCGAQALLVQFYARLQVVVPVVICNPCGHQEEATAPTTTHSGRAAPGE